jgi:hypothetical protein
MFSAVEAHVLERISAAQVRPEPFPHCVIDEIFPTDFYESILDHWPQAESWEPLSASGRVRGYDERFAVLMDDRGFARLDDSRRALWRDGIAAWLLNQRFCGQLLEKFQFELQESGFGVSASDARGDGLIVSDRTNYAIGPHTDAPHKVATLLFYLPEDDAFRRFGTSFYAPVDGRFRCRGGPHHPVEGFRRLTTVEFLPNRLVAFPKSDRSFHGVERIDLPGIDRRLLIYNVRRISGASQ